jgi:metallophosphoesterase (TIGR00282 family)
MTTVRMLMIGDIVGKPGRQIVQDQLAKLRAEEKLHLIIANAENAADGSGITPKIYRALREAGVDCVTLGDHIYRRSEIYETLREETRILKPANYPPDAPGRGSTVVMASNGVPVAVFSLQGRVFMRPVDCPFTAAKRVLEELPPQVRVRCLDFHAEATSDKQIMGRLLDGRVSAVVGTHTHVPTADEQIFPGGTAYITDLGMTGPYESILGRRIDRVTETTISFRPSLFEVALDDVRLSGVIIEVDAESGKALSIRRIMVRAANSKA